LSFEDQFVYKPPQDSEVQAEFGTSYPIRWIGEGEIKCYDQDGNELKIPKCEKCDAYKSQLIGEHGYIWICTCCD